MPNFVGLHDRRACTFKANERTGPGGNTPRDRVVDNVVLPLCPYVPNVQ